MSKFLNRDSEGWQCVRDSAIHRLLSKGQINKLNYQNSKNASDELGDEIISEEAFKQYENATVRDELTGLYNARYFANRLIRELNRAKRYKRPFSLMLVAMDKLTQAQKLYGNLVACQIVQEQAKALISTVREVDIVFRIGCDQFAILFPETYASQTIIAGKRVCETTRSRLIKSGADNVVVTVSIGIASFPTHGRENKDLFKTAAQFLEQAQKSGGNTVCTG